MGKIEDMRRQREQQVADSDAKIAKRAAKPAAAPAEVAAPPKAVAAERTTPTATDDTGKCAECGKTKPVQNGVMAPHQKGFGKACAGSRKPPA